MKKRGWRCSVARPPLLLGHPSPKTTDGPGEPVSQREKPNSPRGRGQGIYYIPPPRPDEDEEHCFHPFIISHKI